MKGFYCYQNSGIKITDEIKDVYYYHKMSEKSTEDIMRDLIDNKFWNSVNDTLLSKKLEYRNTSAVSDTGGLFVKQGERVKKGEEVLNLGGLFYKKHDIKYFRNDSYIAIDKNIYLGASGINSQTFVNANHCCKPNCVFKDDKITFVADRDLNENEEIFINYDKIGNRFNKNFNCLNTSCDQYNICKIKNSLKK